jgi:hypothetical protein
VRASATPARFVRLPRIDDRTLAAKFCVASTAPADTPRSRPGKRLRRARLVNARCSGCTTVEATASDSPTTATASVSCHR